MNHTSFGSSVNVLIWSKFLDFKSLMSASASNLLNFRTVIFLDCFLDFDNLARRIA